KIEVRGTRKIEPEAVLEKLSIKEGVVLDNYLLRKNIKNIYSMKYFESVEAHAKEGEPGVLVFVVKERPVIGKISFEGNDEIDDDDLKGKIKTKDYNIIDVNSLKADALALQKYYEEKGYFLATV